MKYLGCWSGKYDFCCKFLRVYTRHMVYRHTKFLVLAQNLCYTGQVPGGDPPERLKSRDKLYSESDELTEHGSGTFLVRYHGL